MSPRRAATISMFFSVTAIVAALTALLILAGCSSPQVTGTITGKEHEAAEYKTERTCAAKKDGKCTRYTTKRVLKDAEEWELTVVDAAGEEHEVDVSRATYDAVKVGDKWPR